MHHYTSTPHNRFNLNEASLEDILLSPEQHQQPQFLNNQEIVPYIVSQPELPTQIIHQFNERNWEYPVIVSQQQHVYETTTLEMDTCANETSIFGTEDFLTPIEKKLFEMETSSEYSESSPSASHSVRLVRVGTLYK